VTKTLQFSLLFLVLLPPFAAFAGHQDIYVPGRTGSFAFKWVSTETGTQDVLELWADEPQAQNDDNSPVIAWTWNKGPGTGWAGWGMQWLGWNVPIDFYDMVGQPQNLRDPSGSAAADQAFTEKARTFNLSFFVKGNVPQAQQSGVEVKFDGVGDIPSNAVPFLDRIVDDSGQPSRLSQTEFRRVEVPLNEFRIVRSRIDGNAIKHIVFGTPSDPGATGELFIYGIRISP
jgi:hypothetical protein